MIQLIYPTLEYSDQIMEMRSELLETDRINYIHGSGNLQDYDDPKEWIRYVENIRHKETCPKNDVDSDVYLVLRKDDNRIIGFAALRHHINDPLLNSWGGHIGYSVRPSERRKGYAHIILRLVLDCSFNLGIYNVLLTCNENNVASEKTIIKAGGIYESTVIAKPFNMKMKRFWIKLDNKSKS